MLSCWNVGVTMLPRAVGLVQPHVRVAAESRDIADERSKYVLLQSERRVRVGLWLDWIEAIFLCWFVGAFVSHMGSSIVKGPYTNSITLIVSSLLSIHSSPKHNQNKAHREHIYLSTLAMCICYISKCLGLYMIIFLGYVGIDHFVVRCMH